MIIISLGSNVTSRWGNSDTTILTTLREELQRFGIKVLYQSNLYRTKPFGPVHQPDFINAAALIGTSLPPPALLSRLKKIEARAGRQISERWGPRPLDIDIIDYKSQIINWSKDGKPLIRHNDSNLILPHPGAASRPFVLKPVSDIVPIWHHPIYHLTANQLLKRLRSQRMGQIIEIVQ